MRRVNWCRTCGGGKNFGDQLTPALLAHYGVPHEWAPPAQADLVMVGSILSKVPDGWEGAVLGTGFIRAGIRRDLSRATVLAVRGPLTRDACGLPAGTQLGDAGLLAPRLVPDLELTGEFPLGVLPHHVDHDLAAAHPGVHLIDIHEPPATVVREIARCRHLTTSSLHGIVTADALGIPHTWIAHPGVLGAGWKFADYAGAFGQVIEPGRPRPPTPRAVLEAHQAALEALVGRL